MGTHSVLQDSHSNGIRIAVEDFSFHLAGLEAELAEAGSIVLTRGEQVVAEVKPLRAEVQARRKPFHERMPDFEAQLKELYGSQVLPDSTPLIRADRDGE